MTTSALRSRMSFILLGSYLTLVLALIAVLSFFIGVFPALQLVVAIVLLATLPGAALVRRVVTKPGIVLTITIGTVLGLGLWAVGGMLSHATGLVLVRWIPVFLSAALWAFPRSKGSKLLDQTTHPFPAAGVGGSVVGMVTLFPLLLGVLRSQPTTWTGWYHFYTDLPFHIAITSEVAARAPEQTPWVANNTLNYTWLFHSAMGVWGSGTGVSSADIVLQAWPILYVVIMPLLIAVVAWEITHSRVVASVSPLIYVFAQGLVFVPEEFRQIPVFQISPTRDFADFFILITVLALTKLLGKKPTKSFNAWWLVIMSLSVFVATGAKGSSMPILLGGLLCAGLYLLVMRRIGRNDLIVLVVFGLSALISYFLVLPDPRVSESLSWGPLTFLSTSMPNRAALSLLILAMLSFSIWGIFVTIGKSTPEGFLISSLLCGVLLAGLLGLGLLTHPGFSQVYFWQNAQPILAITLGWCGAILYQQFGWKFAIAVVVVFVIVNVIWFITHRTLATGLSIVALSVLATLFFSRRGLGSVCSTRAPSLLGRTLAILAFTGVMVQTAQPLSLPMGTPGGMVSSESDPGAINSSQLAAFLYIRAHSQPEDIVITNKHCVGGSLSENDCDGRWFALAAWSERRVLVDGWGYTQNGSARGWVSTQLGMSDDFIASPNESEKSNLLKMGVRYVYVDAREPHGDLASVSTLVFDSRWASVYSLAK